MQDQIKATERIDADDHACASASMRSASLLSRQPRARLAALSQVGF